MTGFQTWLDGNAVMKRNFRAVAQITGLIERQVAGLRKSGRQTTFSSDILYDMLRKYDPDHLLLEITRQEALHGFIDFDRVHDMIERTGGRVIHRQTERVTPLAAPLLLEAGRIPVDGAARERILVEDAAKLMQEAGLE
jgi:ATP-dependent Lhr-like helicase